MFEMVIPPESPCGCESGKPFGKCHLKGGRIEVTEKRIHTPGHRTTRSNQKCAFGGLHDCVPKMSGDHILSEAVLTGISDDKIVFSGTHRTISVSAGSDALKTKWVCKRHNEALSPLDHQAGRLFRALRRAEEALASPGSPAPLRFYIFSGLDIERWMLKTLLAAYFAKVSNVHAPEYRLPPECLRPFFIQSAAPYGLYFPVRADDGGQKSVSIERAASISLLTHGDVVSGITVTLAGVELTLVIAGPWRIDPQRLEHRPKFINMYAGSAVMSILFAWPGGIGREIWLSRGEPDAALPSN